MIDLADNVLTFILDSFEVFQQDFFRRKKSFLLLLW
jgi:hypothetical protein